MMPVNQTLTVAQVGEILCELGYPPRENDPCVFECAENGNMFFVSDYNGLVYWTHAYEYFKIWDAKVAERFLAIAFDRFIEEDTA